MSRGSRAIGPPPATMPTPTSHCEMTVFSLLANAMSQASRISLPFPVARPRIRAIEATGARVRRTRKSGQGGRPVGPGGSDSMSSSRARKSEWLRKKPSTALSKTTTLTSSSDSTALMSCWNWRTVSGPMTLSGGLSNVTRQ